MLPAEGLFLTNPFKDGSSQVNNFTTVIFVILIGLELKMCHLKVICL